ncbi:MAG: cell division protein ZipA [Gammaproteobacteria bacterium]|nr:cell division protein ZipA [Gammaproteobacteria bacterium]
MEAAKESKVDIKDFILIGGGFLIAAVIAHGFWIAWRGRREPLRLDIVPDIIADDIDNIDRLRGELPNGGARVVARDTVGKQEMLELDAAPILVEPTPVNDAQPAQTPAMLDETSILEPSIEAPAAAEHLQQDPATSTARVEPTAGGAQQRPQVAEVVIPDEPLRPLLRPSLQPSLHPPGRPRRPAARKDADKPVEPISEQPPVEELIVINVLAADGEPFTGDRLFAVLRGNGLKFGDMNIFHRQDPKTRNVNYSVANVVEPGTFDMADMEAFRSPGLCFFLQLPGPDNPSQVFEDMVRITRDVATDLGGELTDEQRSHMTPQNVEHYRQRIADFSRRRMSKRA